MSEEELIAKITVTITYESKNPAVGKGSNDFNDLQELKIGLINIR
ncbi:MAG: hypothetical protein Q8M29_03765 [Bacteroidota bacterium]|nr:hypothetical protein [Bacteroidota bacterium]